MEPIIASQEGFVSGGRWATEQFMRHGIRPESLRPCRDASDASLRANALLTRDSWIHFDTQAVMAAQERLRAVQDLFDAGLTVPVPNAMGRTVIQYDQLTDMSPAQVTMDPAARTIFGRVTYNPVSLPNAIVHKDFNLGIREIAAHQDRGEALDTTHIRNAGRMVAEGLEDLLLNGGPTFAGGTIYGYTTHPNRNTVAFGTGGAWGAGAKTGEQILADTIAMLVLAEADGFYGPFQLYVSGAYSPKMAGDFKANGSDTILDRLRRIDSIRGVTFVDRLNAAVVLVQMTSDVVVLYDGQGITTAQWDIEGGMRVGFKVFAIQVPGVKANAAGGSGLVHMS